MQCRPASEHQPRTYSRQVAKSTIRKRPGQEWIQRRVATCNVDHKNPTRPRTDSRQVAKSTIRKRPGQGGIPRHAVKSTIKRQAVKSTIRI